MNFRVHCRHVIGLGLLAAGQTGRDYPESVYVRRQLSNYFIIPGVDELYRMFNLVTAHLLLLQSLLLVHQVGPL